jgi:hypothetical protein
MGQKLNTARINDLAWRENVSTRLASIEAKLVPKEEVIAMRVAFEDFRRYLGGDGQPGLCELRGEEMKLIEGRIGKIESRQAWWAGAATVAAIVFGRGISILRNLIGR